MESVVDLRRLTTAYEPAFRALWCRVRSKGVQRRVGQLLHRTLRDLRSGMSPQDALAEQYARLRRRIIDRLVHRRALSRTDTQGSLLKLADRSVEKTRRLLEASIPAQLPPPDAPAIADFHCDSGLGGLARWLRAAGYDARFFPGIDDDDLIRRTLESTAILLTTDQPLMRRAVIQWGAVPALLVPLQAGKRGQLEFVLQQFALPRKPARCMACGGPLAAVDKEQNRHRIPPRTYPWCDEYFECERCQKLFWSGTHWGRIERILKSISELAT